MNKKIFKNGFWEVSETENFKLKNEKHKLLTPEMREIVTSKLALSVSLLASRSYLLEGPRVPCEVSSD